MPTSKTKNMLYRVLLPICAPGNRKVDISCTDGHRIYNQNFFQHLIRKHHILGSSTLIESGKERALICTSSYSPVHKADRHTLYCVASITKTATSVLTMRLVDLNILDLDAFVSDYFESDSAGSVLQGITLRHLLSHTSGLSDPACIETDLINGKPFYELVPDARVQQPGHVFHYSNFGFGLIGCIIESVIQRPVGEIFRDYLFAPLNMNASLEGRMLPRDKIMPVTRVLPYKKGTEHIITKLGSIPLLKPDPLRHYGHTAGSMYTDILSLLTLIHVLQGRIHFLSSDSIEQIKKVHASYGSVSPTLSYGLGLLKINDRSISEHCIYGHQGFAYGCVDGAFWEEGTERIMITLNGGCSEARTGRLGLSNRDFLRWAFQKELTLW